MNLEIQVLPMGAGLGGRLDAIHAWCDQHVGRDHYALTHDHERESIREFLQVGFREEETAAFRTWQAQ